MIDVSQSVERDHPHAFDFLRSDIQNGDDFFARRGVTTLGLTKTFHYVTQDSHITGRPESDEDMTLEANRLITLVETMEEDDQNEEANVEKELAEAVFAQSYIPRALDQVYDPERDVAKVLRGEGEGLIYSAITGVAKIQKTRFLEGEEKVEEARQQLESSRENDDDEEKSSASEGSDEEEEEEDEVDEFGERKPRGHKHEDRDEKKVRSPLFFLSFLLSTLVTDRTDVLIHRHGEMKPRKRRGRNERRRCRKGIKREK